MTSGKEQRNDRRDTQPKRCIHACPLLGVIDIHRSANDVHYINVIIYATPRADDHFLIGAYDDFGPFPYAGRVAKIGITVAIDIPRAYWKRVPSQAAGDGTRRPYALGLSI